MIELDVEDIKEAAECIRRSRKIIMALRDANEFEENFIKVKSKIPKTFFQSSKVNNSMIEKVMIFILNHITKGPFTYYVILFTVKRFRRVTFFLVNRVEHQKLNQTTAELSFG